jgi:hypothetical protein
MATVVAATPSTSWRELHFHKVNGEHRSRSYALSLFEQGSSIPVTFGDDEFNPNEGGRLMALSAQKT